MCRAKILSSSGVSRAQEEEHIQQLLQKNGYPVALITRHSLPQSVPWNEEQTARASVTVPYIHGLSQSICRVMSHLVIKVTFRPFETRKQELVHPKDPVPEKQSKGVVYSIPCGKCPWTYIGQTSRTWSMSGRALMGSQEWGCVGLSNCWTRACCSPPGGSLKSHSNTHTLTCHDLLPPTGISSMNRPLLIEERELCQDSMPPCWTDSVLDLSVYYIVCPS